MEGHITGTTKLMGLIGSPVSHSGSPAMHNYACALLGLDYAYLAFEVKKEEAGAAVEAMRTFHMAGCNVTMPCKAAVIPYLDELSEEARLMGAVNTIVNRDGRLIGHNTDGIGFVKNLADHGVSVKGKKLVLCGAGGAATAILVQCALDGAASIVVMKRKNDTFAKTQAFAKELMDQVAGVEISVEDMGDAACMKKAVLEADIFINATSVGMKPNDGESPIGDVTCFHPDLVVCDVVYNPIETRLLAEAKAAGCQTVGGKGMLLWQGVEAFSLFTGHQMPVAQVKEKYFKEA